MFNIKDDCRSNDSGKSHHQQQHEHSSPNQTTYQGDGDYWVIGNQVAMSMECDNVHRFERSSQTTTTTLDRYITKAAISTQPSSPSPPSSAPSNQVYPHPSALAIRTFSSTPTNHHRSQRHFATGLTSPELCALYRVQSQVSDQFPEERTLPLMTTITDHHEFIRTHASDWAEHYGRRIVRFAKSHATFRALPESGQLVQLRPAFMAILTVRFAFNWDDHREGFYLMANESGDRALFSHRRVADFFRNQALVEQNVAYHRRLAHELESDRTIRDLVLAWLLFRPQPQLVDHVELVRYTGHVYGRLLCRYLEHKYRNMAEVDRKWRSLRRVIATIDAQQAVNKRLLEELPAGLISPLAAELMQGGVQ